MASYGNDVNGLVRRVVEGTRVTIMCRMPIDDQLSQATDPSAVPSMPVIWLKFDIKGTAWSHQKDLLIQYRKSIKQSLKSVGKCFTQPRSFSVNYKFDFTIQTTEVKVVAFKMVHGALFLPWYWFVIIYITYSYHLIIILSSWYWSLWYPLLKSDNYSFQIQAIAWSFRMVICC